MKKDNKQTEIKRRNISFSLILIIILFSIIGLYSVGKFDTILNKTSETLEVFVFPEPEGLVEIEIDTNGQNLPEAKKDGYIDVILKILIDEKELETYGKIRVQGSSTAVWPKKNWEFKLYSDPDRINEIKIKIGNSIVSDKWIAKADWIDPTMLRNGISYKLWGEIVDSRESTPKYEIDNALLVGDASNKWIDGAQGFPRIYTGRVKINNEHYGITTLLLGHDPNNFNIDKTNPNHMYIEFDARGGYTEDKTWDKFKSEGIGEWINGYFPENEDMTDAQKESIDKLGKFINSPLENFKKDFDKYLDKTNIIDMLIYLEAIYDWDAVAQDIEMVTYDLEKWYMLPWDKDTTFGMFWDGSGIEKDAENKLLIDYENEDVTERPWYKTYHAFTNEVEERYAELRNKDVLTVSNLQKLINSINDKISEEIWENEANRWNKEGRPSVDETSPEQILEWFELKLKVLDKHFNYQS